MKDLLVRIACWNLNEIGFFKCLNSSFNKSISCQPSRSLALTGSAFWTFPFVTSFTNLNETFLTKIMAALICKSNWCHKKIWILISLPKMVPKFYSPRHIEHVKSSLFIIFQISNFFLKILSEFTFLNCFLYWSWNDSYDYS